MKTLLAGACLASGCMAAHAASSTLEEVLVVGKRDADRIELTKTLDIAPDTAQLLKRSAGANVLTNGPLTGIAQYRGMARMRISSRVDGAVISPGGPNWMDPPLSYAPAAMVETLEVFRGSAPVSAGQETIGGVVNASNWRGEFSDDGVVLSGRLRTGVQSASNAALLSAAAAAATPRHKLFVAGFQERAHDSDFPGGRVQPSKYRRDRFDLGYGRRVGSNTFELSFGRNNTGDSGTPALPMDIGYIDADLYGFSHQINNGRLAVDSHVYYNDINHGMTNYEIRTPPPSASLYRRNTAAARNFGFNSKVSFEGWEFGIDADLSKHNSDIDNPNAPAFFVDNFHNAKRDVFGVFVETEHHFGERWRGNLGARYNVVALDSDTVDATPAASGMAPAVTLRDEFNAAGRSRADHNVDLVGKLRYTVSDELDAFASASRKTRSPSYQERFLWLPLQSTAGLADGMTYTGNLDLNPEIAYEAELGVEWLDGPLRLTPRVYYRYVDDYIQGTPSDNMAAVMFVRMMNAMNGTSAPDPLEFNNVDAIFYGFDIDGRIEISPRWSLDGGVSYTRGKRDDTSDNLYRIPPLNGFLALGYTRAGWGAVVESFLYADQNEVSDVNQEQKSDAYGLFNVRGFWDVARGVRLAVGVDNLMDKTYRDHLSGINRVAGNPDLAVGEPLPGIGRSFSARLDVKL